VIIFLDANVIIYQVEGVEPFQCQVLTALREMVQQYAEVSFAVSRLSTMECLVKPVRERDNAVIDRYHGFFTATDLKIVEVTSEVLETAILLRGHHGLRTPDAIQAASALSLKTPVIFLTGDRSFKNVPGLEVRLIN
jgi:predicted nucleic acid-binding protein